MKAKVDYKTLSRGISRDMSSPAILRRLKIASNLRDTAIRLSRTKFVHKVNSVKMPIQPVPPPGSTKRGEGGKKTKKVIR